MTRSNGAVLEGAWRREVKGWGVRSGVGRWGGDSLVIRHLKLVPLLLQATSTVHGTYWVTLTIHSYDSE